jgi:hypothetical protein
LLSSIWDIENVYVAWPIEWSLPSNWALKFSSALDF